MRLAVFAMLGCTALAQPAFEVAAIKPADPSVRSAFQVLPGGRLSATGVTLETLIREIYQVQTDEISGGPGWIRGDRFTITAKAEGEPSRERMMAMLLTLLEDRFKLNIRRVTKQGTVFVLTEAKGGRKLREPEHADAPSRILIYHTGPPEEMVDTTIFKGQNASIALLAKNLKGELGRPVIDRTGFAGNFDFRIQFASDDAHLDDAPALVSAVEKQLGLKLESAKGPVETLIVDHAEKPSAN
jgi:uncharacterized protein (TIGR03435 family)